MFAQAAQESAGWLEPVQSALSWTTPDAFWIDCCRTVVIVAALGLTLIQLRLAWGKGRPADRALREGLSAFILLDLAVTFQEIQQLGERFVPWRLPIFAAVIVLAWQSAIRRL